MSGNSHERKKVRRAVLRANARWREAHAEEIAKVAAWLSRTEVPEFVPSGFHMDSIMILRRQAEKMSAFGLPPSTREELREFLVRKGVSFSGNSSTLLSLMVIR